MKAEKTCPTCGAEPGHRCRNTSPDDKGRHRYVSTHQRRINISAQLEQNDDSRIFDGRKEQAAREEMMAAIDKEQQTNDR